MDAWFARETAAKIRTYLREHNVTLFMFLLAVLDAYLYRITGDDDIVIGAPIANRDDDALRDMLGLFAMPLPLRARMHERMTFGELLRQMSPVSIEGYENHRYPSNLLIEQLPLPKDLSRSKLFSVMYGVQNNKTALLDNFHLEGMKISLDERMHGAEWTTARFDLTLVVDQFGDDISLALNYNTRLFKRPTAQRMLREFMPPGGRGADRAGPTPVGLRPHASGRGAAAAHRAQSDPGAVLSGPDDGAPVRPVRRGGPR